MSIRELAFSVINKRGDRVHGDVRYRVDAVGAPVVVMCHGFKGFKDWGTFPYWGRRLAEAGFVSVLFNFSYNGVTPEEPAEFTRLDLFADNTYTRELDDLEAVLDAVADERLGVPADPSRIGLTGHSRGGGIAVVKAAEDERVRTLATWSSVSSFLDRIRPEQVEDWSRRGFTEVVNARTGQVMRLNRILYDDLLANEKRLDVRAAAARVQVPWLIVHAEDDEAVPFREAEELHAASAGRARLLGAGGGHTFGGRHPFDGSVPNTLQTVFDETLAFFEETLRPGAGQD